MTGIVMADYFVVHRRELHLDDLYIGNHTSAYWYTAGFNWRAPVAWYARFPRLFVPPQQPIIPPTLHRLTFSLSQLRAMGVWPLLPGFANQVRGASAAYGGWDNIFRINFFVGFGIAFVLHVALHTIFPAPGARGASSFVGERRAGVLAGGDGRIGGAF
jgi:nucleobase:cation symporter-1, NCS1 family